MTDFYKILNIPRSATEKEIKKAYRKLAVKWHPDKNKTPEAQQKFQEIGEAYGVLRDPEKKANYDKFGKAGLDGNMGGVNPNDLFASMFGGGGGGMFGGGMFGGGGFGGFGMPGMPGMGNFQQRVNRKGPTKTIEIPISFKEMYTGCKKKFAISRNKKCADCYASGLKKGTNPTKCDMCQGSGKHVIQRRTPMGIMQQISICPKCKGRKTSIRDSDKCSSCNGQKYIKTKEIVGVKIRQGIIEGEKIILEEMGDESESWTTTGNIEFIIKLKPEKNVRRFRNNIYYKKKILLSEALAGLELSIEHPNGSFINIKYEGIIKPNENYVLHNMGFINNDQVGDIIFEFDIVFPSTLDSKRKEIIQKILPKRQVNPNNNNNNAKVYVLEPGEKYNSENIENADFEEVIFPDMGSNVECNQQ